MQSRRNVLKTILSLTSYCSGRHGPQGNGHGTADGRADAGRSAGEGLSLVVEHSDRSWLRKGCCNQATDDMVGTRLMQTVGFPEPR